MPRKPVQKKDPNDMTTQELAEHIFPLKVLEQLNRIAHEKDVDVETKQKRRKGK